MPSPASEIRNGPEISRSGEIEVFVGVVEAGSFLAAARALRMTPSAVSKLIARLEARLGARLISRSTRRLQLMPEGVAFHDSGVRILADLDAAEREAAAGAAPRGRLRINAYVPFGQHRLMPLLPRFQKPRARGTHGFRSARVGAITPSARREPDAGQRLAAPASSLDIRKAAR